MNQTTSRPRWTRWLWTVVPMAVMLLFQFTIALTLNLWIQRTGGLDPRVLQFLPFLSFLLPLFLILLWLWRRRREEGLDLVFWTRQRWVRDVALGVGLAVPCVLVFLGSLRLLHSLGLPTPDFSAFTPAHHLFFATLGALSPGIGEEIYFRGFLMRKFRDLSPVGVILITSLSFAFWHILSPPYLLHTFLIGVILGIAVHRTGRLLPVMVAHTLTNAGGGLLLMAGVL